MMVDGSKLRILRMNDYKDYSFRDGKYFDTVKTFNFLNETIQNVAVADLEGDGRNDLIVTTNDSTYIVGIKLYDRLDITYPLNSEIFCAEEIIPLSWSNIFFKDRTLYGDDDTNFVDIFFRPYIDGIASDSLILIKSNVENVSDTVIYEYLIDSLVLGYQGRFIVQSIDFPAQTKDSSAIISFERPKVNVDNLEKSTYFSGERISLSGTILCYDSLALEYSYDLINWIRIADEANDEAGYSISGILPCGQFFDCLDPDLDSILYLQIVSYKSIYSDTSEILSIKLLPEVFPLVIEPCENSCPTIEFKWDLSKMTNVCDSITISYTSLNSDTFSLIAKVSAYDEHYLWNIPTNIPEWTKIRFCCENSCIRTDTVLHDIRPTYIGIVAPNPFTPPYEEVSVDYRVPKSSYVTIRIYDQANRLVKELLKSAPRQPGIVYCQKWNGQIWDGSIAANGIYYLSLELSHGEKEIYPIYIKK